MSYDNNYIDPITVALIGHEVFFREYSFRYRTIIDIYNEGLKRMREHISDLIQKSNLKNDGGGFAEDEFTILNELDDTNSHIFKVYTIVTMYSECEMILKEWLTYLYGHQEQIRNMEVLKNKYDGRRIDLTLLNGYQDFECLRLLNNSIKHNDSVARHSIDCRCLSKVFNRGDSIQLSQDQIIILAEKLSQFMIAVLNKVEGALM